MKCKTCKYNNKNYCEYWDDSKMNSDGKCTAYKELVFNLAQIRRDYMQWIKSGWSKKEGKVSIFVDFINYLRNKYEK